jgi:hypothetical protein
VSIFIGEIIRTALSDEIEIPFDFGMDRTVIGSKAFVDITKKAITAIRCMRLSPFYICVFNT